MNLTRVRRAFLFTGALSCVMGLSVTDEAPLWVPLLLLGAAVALIWAGGGFEGV